MTKEPNRKRQDHLSAEEFQRLFGSGAATRNKYGAKRCSADNHSFDSQVERDWYLNIKDNPTIHHIDIHPVLTLPGGVRYCADFLVHREFNQTEVHEVKGRKPTTDWIRAHWIPFNEHHPFGPLVVVSRADRGRGDWRMMTDPEEIRSW